MSFTRSGRAIGSCATTWSTRGATTSRSLYPVIAVVLAAPVYLLSALGPLSAEHDLFEVLEKAAAAAIVALSAVFLYLALRRRTTETMAVGLTSSMRSALRV
jgi:hypothetical protein